MQPTNIDQTIKDKQKRMDEMAERAETRKDLGAYYPGLIKPIPTPNQTSAPEVDYIITHEPLKKFTIRCAGMLEKVDNTLSKGIIYADKKISEIREEYPTTNRFFDALGFVVTKETAQKKKWQKMLREPSPRRHGMGFDVNSRLQEAKAAV